MHFIKNNGKIIPLQMETTSSPLLTENVLYKNPVAGNQLEFKEWGERMLLAGGVDLDGIPEKPTLKVIDHTYISDWNDVLPEYTDGAAAIAGGLATGKYFRTGEIVKQVLPLV